MNHETLILLTQNPGVVIKTLEEIEKMKISGQIVAEVLKKLSSLIEPGLSTWELDQKAALLTSKLGARAAFKGYRGFPNTICTSINYEIVHGIPSKDRILKTGDIISIDYGVFYEGFYSDAAFSQAVGRVNKKAEKLLETTQRALYCGIEKMVYGNRLSDISYAIQKTAEDEGFSVVREFVGHGIGKKLHEAPQIPNYGQPGQGLRLKPGMVFAIEPMINEGTWEVEVLTDNWTAVTKDRKLSAHFEHTVALLEDKIEILTQPN